MYNGSVSDGYPAADMTDLAGRGMDDRPLFEGGACPYFNATIISPQDNTVPNITFLIDQDIPDDNGVFTDIGILTDFRHLTIEFV